MRNPPMEKQYLRTYTKFQGDVTKLMNENTKPCYTYNTNGYLKSKYDTK